MTMRPGIPARSASKVWECWAARLKPAPPGERTTSGREYCPPDMYLSLAAWLTMGSMQQVRKSESMISATGLIPVMAAPTAEPTMAYSLMGVSSTLSGPNSSTKPAVTAK